MKFMIKPVFLSAIMALGSMHCELAAQPQQKSLSQRVTAAMRRNKTATAVVALGIGAFIAHKALIYCHANKLAGAEAELTNLSEAAVIKDTVDCANFLSAEPLFAVYKDFIANGTVHTDKEIPAADVDRVFETYQMDNLSDETLRNWPDNPIVRHIVEHFTKLNELSREIARLPQGSAEQFRQKIAYIKGTQRVARNIIDLETQCQNTHKEVQQYYKDMVKPTAPLTADYCKRKTTELLATFTEQVRTNTHEDPFVLFWIDRLKSSAARHETRDRLNDLVPQLRADSPYPLWRKIFGPQNNN